MTKRNVPMDISRAVCMLWIVGIWHLQEYMVIKNSWNNPYTTCVTVSVLSMFTFLSGYFLSGKIKNVKECLCFYKKRLLRFYPLFFVASISLFLFSKFFGAGFIQTFQQLIFTLTGLSCFIKPYPATVWYLAMLISFYAITPFINMVEWGKRKILILISIYLLLIIGVLYGQTDIRILIYFPVYVVGLLIGKKITFFTSEVWSGKGMLLSLLVWVASIIICVRCNSLICFQLLVAMTAIVPLYYVGVFLNRWEYAGKLLTKISYASMCAYLFHRQFYGVTRVALGDFTFVTAYLIIVPLLLIASYTIQKIYDTALLIITKKRCSV